MSYRCQKCNVVCEHSRIPVVVERRADGNIAKEIGVCEDCAVDFKINVPAPRPYIAESAEQTSTLVGSA